ncbi:MAG TPA: gliding motility-associated protein GldE [Flavobacteriaceae bacterium]|nr:gliding motility-associated protein GldE [Flavobacteriaceae bacterium]HEX5742905.1 gliding motility-associated protein GldE [Flavobacteriaceae bacterium]
MDTDSFQFLFENFNEINWTVIWSIISIIILLIFSALISGAEVAFFSLKASDLDENSKKNQILRVSELLQNPQKLLATILISNNFVNILIVLLFAGISEFFFKGIEIYFIRFIIEVILITFLILLFGEVIPKLFASRNALKFASFISIPLQLLNFLLSPFTYPLINLTSLIEKKLAKKKGYLSVEKLSRALELTSDNATTKEEQKILEGIINFGNTDTSQVMKPRMDIIAFAESCTFKEIVEKIIENGFSRNPVYGENIDNIIGVLYAKDILPYLNEEDYDWKQLIRKPFFVPENKKLDDLLLEFQEKKIHFAVVVDEYGGTSGIITLEDIIEEIVGDISDEFDDEDLFYTKIDKYNYLFDGKTNLKDFYKVLDLDEENFEEFKGESETLAGFILEITGRFLRKNEEITFSNLKFKIELLDRKRIKQIKVTILDMVD